MRIDPVIYFGYLQEEEEEEEIEPPRDITLPLNPSGSTNNRPT